MTSVLLYSLSLKSSTFAFLLLPSLIPFFHGSAKSLLFHLILGLPLPPSTLSGAALFINRSPSILSACPVHFNLPRLLLKLSPHPPPSAPPFSLRVDHLLSSMQYAYHKFRSVFFVYLPSSIMSRRFHAVRFSTTIYLRTFTLYSLYMSSASTTSGFIDQFGLFPVM